MKISNLHMLTVELIQTNQCPVCNKKFQRGVYVCMCVYVYEFSRKRKLKIQTYLELL
jgi:hypothetical protein